MIGYGDDLPADTGVGVACGWWPCYAAPSGAFVKVNADGTATIVTGATETGTGAVMHLAALAAGLLGTAAAGHRDPRAGHRPRPAGTRAPPARRRRSTTAVPCSPPRADTGVVRVLEVAAAHDSGAILNRPGADGQVYSGVTMGIGQALLERTQLTPEGRHRNAHLLEYKLVTAADMPAIGIHWVETPTAGAGPGGAKGVGEAPCIPTAVRSRTQSPPPSGAR